MEGFSKIKSVILSGLLTFGVVSLVLVQSMTLANAQAYRGLVIDEIKYDFGMQPRGNTITRTFHITHDFQDKNKVVTLYFRAADFTSDGSTGTPVFLPKGSLSPEGSLSSWITFAKKSITLDHYGQSEEVTFTITLPTNAEPGGKYAAILISDKEGEDVVNKNNDSSELGISKELGPLVLLITDGEIKRSIVADALYTSNLEGEKTQFFFNLPVNVNAILRNTGNVHIQPNGAIYLYQGDNFQNFLAKFELNEKKGYVLPASTRIFSFEWNDGFMYDALSKDTTTGKVTKSTKFNWDKLSHLRIGQYNVKLLFVAQGDNDQAFTVQKDTYFWVIPWPLIILVVSIVVLGGLFVTYKRVTGKKKSKKSADDVIPSRRSI